MKKIFLFAAGLVMGISAMAQNADDVAKFNEQTHNFGKIKQGVPVTYNFQIKNISDKPLVVANAAASCGCTVPEKPEQPIAPGASANLKVGFNAAALGPINKTITVTFAGISTPKILNITGEVVANEQPADQVVKPQPAASKVKPATKAK